MGVYTAGRSTYSSYKTDEFSQKIIIEKIHTESGDRCKLIWIFIRPGEFEFAVDILKRWKSYRFHHVFIDLEEVQ